MYGHNAVCICCMDSENVAHPRPLSGAGFFCCILSTTSKIQQQSVSGAVMFVCFMYCLNIVLLLSYSVL